MCVCPETTVSIWLSICLFFLMIRRPPRSTRTDTLFPYTTLFRSAPLACASAATTELSTPPDMATTMRRRAGFAPSWKSPSIIGAAHKPRRAAMQSRDGFQALAREFTGPSDTRIRSYSRTSGNEKVRRAWVDLGLSRFDKSEAVVEIGKAKD